jgi:hypothetical protein
MLKIIAKCIFSRIEKRLSIELLPSQFHSPIIHSQCFRFIIFEGIRV